MNGSHREFVVTPKRGVMRRLLVVVGGTPVCNTNKKRVIKELVKRFKSVFDK